MWLNTQIYKFTINKVGKEFMSVEKHGNQYRVKKQVDGKKYVLTFNHYPTQKEIRQELEKVVDNEPAIKDSFKACAEAYIKAKEDVLSPSTVRGYLSYLKNMPEWFTEASMSTLGPLQVQQLISEYAADKAPKYAKNISGFVTPVFKMFAPKVSLNTTLPKEKPKKKYEPSSNDVKRILEASKGSMFEVALWLAVFGVRRSEQVCLTPEDLNGNILSINKAMVQDKKNKWIIKELNKTDESTRDIPLSENVVELIKRNGFYNGHPNSILKYLYRQQDSLGIPRFPLHYFRHYYAAIMSKITDEATVLKMGGWKTDYVMKSRYRYALDESIKQAQEDVNKMVSNLI